MSSGHDGSIREGTRRACIGTTCMGRGDCVGVAHRGDLRRHLGGLADLLRARTPRCHHVHHRQLPWHGSGSAWDERDSAAAHGGYKASAPTSSLDGGGNPSVPSVDIGSSFVWADKGSGLGLLGSVLYAGDTIGAAGGGTIGVAALGLHEFGVNNCVGLGREGGTWTSSQITHGSSTGDDRGIPFVGMVDDGKSLSVGDIGEGGSSNVCLRKDDVLGNIPFGSGVVLSTGGHGSSRGRGGFATSGGGILHDTLGARGGSGIRCINDDILSMTRQQLGCVGLLRPRHW
jgi:hypothetical protein